jgi:putative selenium metabolism hydrolase
MLEEKLINFAQSLIRVPSLSGEEQEVVQVLVREMKSLNFDRVWVDDYGSAVGVIKGKCPGKTLLLDGHCDTVPVMPADWSVDPFAGTIVGENIVGRGVADMKGALAAMIYAAANLNRDRLAGSVVVSATVMEEVFEGATLKNVVDTVKPDFVVIGEATNLALNRAGRGRAEVVLETFGKSAHSSSPEAGLCAVHEMIDLIRSVESAVLPVDALFGSAMMVLTDIISEPYPGHSVVPNRCRASYDYRAMPGETPASIIDIFRTPDTGNIQYHVSIVEGRETTYTGKVAAGMKFFPAWKLEEDHSLIQLAQRGLSSAGIKAPLGEFRFCTNAAYSAGIAHIPTIGFGPGLETEAHTVEDRKSVV